MKIEGFFSLVGTPAKVSMTVPILPLIDVDSKVHPVLPVSLYVWPIDLICRVTENFLDLNRHVLDSCELHRVVDKCFSSSAFGKHVSEDSMIV